MDNFPHLLASLQRVKLPGILRTYQFEGLEFLLQRESALLADEQGLGKTVQVSVALEVLFCRGQLTRALIVVPASLKMNWDREINRWAPTLSVQRVRGNAADRLAWYNLPLNVLIVSYEEIRLDAMVFPTDVKFDVVVLDEAQRIKNADARTALACTSLRRGRSWALTGTPIENRVDDLLSVFRFVKRDLLSASLSKSEIHSHMQPFFLRRRKKEVLPELPPIIDQEVVIQLQGRQRKAYEHAWSHRWDGDDGQLAAPEVSMFALITRLKQLCNYDPVSGESAKLDVLQDYLDVQEAVDDKVIVFSQYVETLRWLAANQSALPCEIYEGGLTQSERDAVLDRFRKQPGPRMLLISLRAGGVGLNLQEASTVILFDRWWNPALESQAIQRAHRFGRDRPLHVIRFLVSDSIEDRIDTVLKEKQALFDKYVETADNALLPQVSRQLMEVLLGKPGMR